VAHELHSAWHVVNKQLVRRDTAETRFGAVEPEGPKVLIVDDDLGLAAMLSDALVARGYRVCHAAAASEAEAALELFRPELVVVDLMLPDRNGLVLCSELKARTGAPVIICSGTKRTDDAVLGFKLGADDFVAKPFSVDELEARMRRALGQPASRSVAHASSENGVQHIGDLAIDRTRCQVTVGNSLVQLTPTEFRLLCQLAGRPSEVVSRRELVESVWGFYDAAVVRSLDVHMRRLRTKLNAATARGPHVATRRGFGYQLVESPG
jgi:two-component system phosphate regulon response regulator PhoB